MNTIKVILIVLAVVIILFAILQPFVVVPAGYRAVLFSMRSGVLKGQLDEGFHLIVPGIQRAFLYDCRTQTYSVGKRHWRGEVRGDASLSALTADGQTVTVDVSLRFRIDPKTLWILHKKVGPDYINKILRPELRSHTRLVISDYPVADVYSEKRQAIEDKIEKRLTASLTKTHLLVDEVLLRDIRFSEAFQQAVIEKQIAQQNAHRMKYVLDKTEKEKEQRIIEAEGEAKAIEIKGQALAKNPNVIRYEYALKIAPNLRILITRAKDLSIETLQSPTDRGGAPSGSEPGPGASVPGNK